MSARLVTLTVSGDLEGLEALCRARGLALDLHPEFGDATVQAVLLEAEESEEDLLALLASRGRSVSVVCVSRVPAPRAPATPSVQARPASVQARPARPRGVETAIMLKTARNTRARARRATSSGRRPLMPGEQPSEWQGVFPW